MGMGYLNYQNDLDFQGMKDAMKVYTPPSDWFERHYYEKMRTCYEQATNLPESVVEQSVVKGESFCSVKMEELKTFFKCCTKEEEKLCMNQETKRKIESNFGPLEEILEQTQLTEYQLDTFTHENTSLGLTMTWGHLGPELLEIVSV